MDTPVSYFWLLLLYFTWLILVSDCEEGLHDFRCDDVPPFFCLSDTCEVGRFTDLLCRCLGCPWYDEMVCMVLRFGLMLLFRLLYLE
jgi:hypothetical protein